MNIQQVEDPNAILQEELEPEDSLITMQDLESCNVAYQYDPTQILPTARILLRIGNIAVGANAVIDVNKNINLISQHMIMKTLLMKSDLNTEGPFTKVLAAAAFFNSPGTVDRALYDEFTIVKSISMESSWLKKENFDVLTSHPTADPEFFKPKTIDIVIGAALSDHVYDGPSTMDSRGYKLAKTKLGYVLSSLVIHKKDLHPYNQQNI